MGTGTLGPTRSYDKLTQMTAQSAKHSDVVTCKGGKFGLLAEVTVQAIQVTIGANECLVLRRGHEISRLQRIPASRLVAAIR